MARTGFASRFLLGQTSMGLSAQVLLTVFVLLVSVGFGALAFASGVQGWREALDPGATMYRLQHPASPGAGRRTLRRAVVLRSESDDRPPLCAVQHEHYVSGKNGGWRVDQRWQRSNGATVEGVGLRVALGETVTFDPPDPVLVRGDQDAWFRTVLADVLPGGRLRAHCVASGETVFVEGCVDASVGQLTGCVGAPLTITTGDGTAQPRIDAHASEVAGQLAGGAAVVVAALGYLWYLLRARPLADALLRRAGPVPGFAAWPLVFAVVGAAGVGLIGQAVMVWSAAAGSAASRGRTGYVGGLIVCAAAAVIALVVRHRRNILERAMAPVKEAETVSLRDARGGVVELAVRVREGAAVPGVLDAKPHAWVEVRVEETCRRGKQNMTLPVARRYWPAEIPVRDASGEGRIDPAYAEIDLRSTVKLFRSGSEPRLESLLASSPLGVLNPSPGHVRWTIEQSVLDPGESLYVLGQCRRVEDPQGAGSYRMDSTMAAIGGTAADKLILHAGDERSLLGSIGRERTYLDLLTAALAGVAVSLAAVMAALWAL